MKRKESTGRIGGVIAAFALAGTLVTGGIPITAAAEDDKVDDVQYIYTDYADLWTSDEITAEAGTPVKWYVVVPDDVEPKGCGATIKIPGLGFGTDTHNKEEGHIVLQKGENFIYEFTPEEAGDILFTCWMGSGCHKNYIHVTAAPDDVSSEEDFSEPESSSVPDDVSSEEDVSEPDSSSVSEAVTPADDSSAADSNSSVADSSKASSSSNASSSSKNSSVSSGKSGGSTGAGKTDSNPATGSAAGGVLAVTVLLGGAAYTGNLKKHR